MLFVSFHQRVKSNSHPSFKIIRSFSLVSMCSDLTFYRKQIQCFRYSCKKDLRILKLTICKLSKKVCPKQISSFLIVKSNKRKSSDAYHMDWITKGRNYQYFHEYIKSIFSSYICSAEFCVSLAYGLIV